MFHTSFISSTTRTLWTAGMSKQYACTHYLQAHSWLLRLPVSLSSFPKLPSNCFTLKGWTTFTSIWSAFPIHNPVHLGEMTTMLGSLLDRRWWLRLILCSHALEFFGEGFCYTYVGIPMLQPCWNTHSQGAPWPKMSHNVAHEHEDWYQDIYNTCSFLISAYCPT